MKWMCFLGLFLGFLLLFRERRLYGQLGSLAKRTLADMDAAARERALEERRRILVLQEEGTALWKLERQLQYSGLKRRMPGLTVEWWIAGNLALLGVVVTVSLLLWGIRQAFAAAVLVWLGETVLLQGCRRRNLRRVNENLMKLLDFLGNYSVTQGEVTAVLEQVSRYMEEPLRGALENCCMEAQLTGDTGLALLGMAERIEHPKFKELARNMEISVRYCADFSAMVNSSRRSMREYQRTLQERKGMLREAFINMCILLVMSLAVLGVVGSLIEMPVGQLLFRTLPGRVALGVILVILLLFAEQTRKIQL